VIRDRIKQVRESLNYSQEAFGSRLGVSGAAISRIESGERNITDQMILSVCREFGIEMSWLKDGTGEMIPQYDNDLDFLVGKFGDQLSPNIKELICILLKMPEEKRKLFEEFLDEYHKLRTKPEESGKS